MNSRLRLKLIRCNALGVAESEAERKRKPEPPALRLLGHGLDAIIQHTRPRGFLALGGKTPKAPSDWERLERYQVAAALFPLFPDPEAAQMRVYLGELRRRAWEAGQYRRGRMSLLQLKLRALTAGLATR